MESTQELLGRGCAPLHPQWAGWLCAQPLRRMISLYFAKYARVTSQGLCAPAPAPTLFKKSRQKKATRSLREIPFFVGFLERRAQSRPAAISWVFTLFVGWRNVRAFPVPKTDRGISLRSLLSPWSPPLGCAMLRLAGHGTFSLVGAGKENDAEGLFPAFAAKRQRRHPRKGASVRWTLCAKRKSTRLCTQQTPSSPQKPLRSSGFRRGAGGEAPCRGGVGASSPRKHSRGAASASPSRNTAK